MVLSVVVRHRRVVAQEFLHYVVLLRLYIVSVVVLVQISAVVRQLREAVAAVGLVLHGLDRILAVCNHEVGSRFVQFEAEFFVIQRTVLQFLRTTERDFAFCVVRVDKLNLAAIAVGLVNLDLSVLQVGQVHCHRVRSHIGRYTRHGRTLGYRVRIALGVRSAQVGQRVFDFSKAEVCCRCAFRQRHRLARRIRQLAAVVRCDRHCQRIIR